MATLRTKKGWFSIRYYGLDGKRREESLGTQNPTVAKRLYQIKCLEIRAGMPDKNSLCMTFSDASILYQNHIERQKTANAIRIYRICLSRIMPYFENRLLGRIGENDIYNFVRSIENRLAAESVRKTVLTLKQIFRFALERGYCASNPALGVRVKSPHNRRDRFFTEKELKKIFAFIRGNNPALAPAYEFLFYTGLRRSELLRLRAEDVDFKNKLLRVEKSKSAAGVRRIPLSLPALAILKRLKTGSGNIFVNPETEKPWNADYFSHYFLDALKTLKIENANLHTMRHSFASHLALAGVPMEVLRDLLGHSSIIVTERYAHLVPEYLRSAVAKLPKI